MEQINLAGIPSDPKEIKIQPIFAFYNTFTSNELQKFPNKAHCLTNPIVCQIIVMC